MIRHLQAVAAQRTTDRQCRAVTDLATVAFFFLLRVGEYTMPASNRRTRTVQFRLCDVTFYRLGAVLPLTAPLESLLSATGVTLNIDNQKNGTRGETIHQHRLVGNMVCPVAALARRVVAIRATVGASASSPISLLPDGSHVTAKMIRTAVRGAVQDLSLHRIGIKASDVGSHSLRAGGAMAMKLNGCDLVTIMKGGRWTSLTFLTYIHNQIAHLGANITGRMASQVPFFCFAP